MEDFTNDRVSPVVKRPKEIIVTVKLPGLVSNLVLNIFKWSVE